MRTDIVQMDVIVQAIPQCNTDVFLDVLRRLQGCKSIEDIKEIKPFINAYFKCGFGGSHFWVCDNRDIRFILIKF